MDCKQLARAFRAQRSPLDVTLTADLRSRFGIDANKTITQIEGIDLGDAAAWGDLPDIHALRHLPLTHFTPADVDLMLVHREAIDVLLPLARIMLERDPLLAAQNFDGDLMLAVASCVACEAFDAHVQVPTRFHNGQPEEAAWATKLVQLAEEKMWADFARAADGRNEKDFSNARRIVSWGPPLIDTPWYSPFDDTMNTLCEARAWLKPPRVRARAVANALYVVPRDGRLQIVPVETFESLAETAEHSFERATVFEITDPRDQEVAGFDLVNRSVSSIEDWRGTRVDDIDHGIDLAMNLFGIPPAIWEEIETDNEGPLDHFELSVNA